MLKLKFSFELPNTVIYSCKKKKKSCFHDCCHNSPWSHDHTGCFFATVGPLQNCGLHQERVHPLLLPHDHLLSLFCCQISDLLTRSLKTSESSPDKSVLYWGCKSFTCRGTPSTKMDYRHPTLEKSCGASTLLCFHPHIVSNLVRTMLGACYWRHNINSFHLDLVYSIGWWGQRWLVTFWSYIVPVDCLCFTVRWHRSAMPFLTGAYAQWNFKFTHRRVILGKKETIQILMFFFF